ncbi:MAG: putative cytochrome P450 [Tepidiforma sp.]|nr:MAG: putative cytochrome P450 [Tepidiforma sp.]
MSGRRGLPRTADLGPRAGLRALATLRWGTAGLYEALEIARDGLGPVFELGFGRFRPVVIGSSEGLREALVLQREALSWRPEGDPVVRLFRRSILVTDGPEHDEARAVMSGAFEARALREAAPEMLAIADDELDRWPEQGKVEAVAAMRRIAWRSFERVFFGYDLRGPELEATLPGLLAALRYIGPGAWVLRGAAGRPPREVRLLERHIRKVIAQPQTGGTMLEALREAFGTERVRDHALTMLIAGHDTSTAQLSWALHLLVRSREWLARATREARAVPAAALAGATADDLPVVEAVLREALRLWPPIHAGARRTVREFQVDGYVVPPGQRVMLSYLLVQRDGTRWREPLVFDPGRWLEGRGAPGPFTWVPFGGGPRNCIGAGFAQLEGRLVLARVLQRFDLAVTRRPLRGAMGATLEPRGGLLGVRRR